jgi:ring-1,2-phenylacetyl-CoA epoxidase subunit PaaC
MAVDPAGLRAEFDAIWRQVLATATLSPATDHPRASEGAGRDGVHTPALGEILAELQGLARSVPGGVW